MRVISAVASAVLDVFDDKSFLFGLKPVIDSKSFNSDERRSSNWKKNQNLILKFIRLENIYLF